jgi:dienelactone hydrolase
MLSKKSDFRIWVRGCALACLLGLRSGEFRRKAGFAIIRIVLLTKIQAALRERKTARAPDCFVAWRQKIGLSMLMLLALPACALRVSGQDLVEHELRIPAPGAGKQGLEAFMVRPHEPGPHPLALINHGSPRAGSDRRKMTPQEMLPQAREFARRGWTTVIVMRRGYGNSGGNFAEDSRACGRRPDFYGSGLQSANDLRAAIAYLTKLPEVDPTRIISIGRSAGGFATVALTANPPAGLAAGISFAGGRGSPAKDQVCNSADLVEAFGRFGKTSRVPMLWVYAQNDHFFSPQLAVEFYRAFTAAGGSAQFVSAGPFGTDGHRLFSEVGSPLWMPMVDAFLQKQSLVLRKTLLPSAEPGGAEPPNH